MLTILRTFYAIKQASKRMILIIDQQMTWSECGKEGKGSKYLFSKDL